MATTALTELFSKMTPYLPGVDTAPPLLLDVLRDLIIEYCEETQCWTCTMDAIKVRAGVAAYDLEKPSYAKIFMIKSVLLDDQPLEPGTGYTMPSHCVIELVNTPSVDTASDQDGLVVEVVLEPQSDATIISTDLFRYHSRQWAWGAIARMMEIPKKAWTNPQMAAYFNDRYWQKVSDAKIEQSRSNMNMNLQAASPYPFAAGESAGNYGKNPFVWG